MAQLRHLLPHANDDGRARKIDVQVVDEVVRDTDAFEHLFREIPPSVLGCIDADHVLLLQCDQEDIVDLQDFDDLLAAVVGHCGSERCSRGLSS